MSFEFSDQNQFISVNYRDLETGEFIAVEQLEIKANTGLPANATLDEAPETGDNEVAIYSAGKWEIRDDYRGYVGYDSKGSEHKITDINITPDESWSTTKPAEPEIITTHFSSKTFFERYTEAEQDAVITASMTSVPIKKAYDKMWGSDFVDVTSQETIDGVDALISVGLLDASRKSDILSTEII